MLYETNIYRILQSGFVASLVFGVLMLGSVAAADDELADGMLTFSSGDLSIRARDTRPEDIVRELGEKCGIKIVVHGEVFSEVPVSIQFTDMPLRSGIKRILRIANITNYVMHFRDGDNGTAIVALDLIGKKGGERHLTSGTPVTTPVEESEPPPQNPRAAIKERRRAEKTGQDDEMDLKVQENFMKIMDEVLKAQLEEGEEPDPAEVLKLFKEVVPPEMKEQIPPEILEELERLEQ